MCNVCFLRQLATRISSVISVNFGRASIAAITVTASLIANGGCGPIGRSTSNSREGMRAMDELTNAEQVEVVGFIGGKKQRYVLMNNIKANLTMWVSKARHESNPQKYRVLAVMRLGAASPVEWDVLEINSVELGLRMPNGRYLCGLSRQEFMAILD